jgi:hypothetical protein
VKCSTFRSLSLENARMSQTCWSALPAIGVMTLVSSRGTAAAQGVEKIREGADKTKDAVVKGVAVAAGQTTLAGRSRAASTRSITSWWSFESGMVVARSLLRPAWARRYIRGTSDGCTTLNTHP